MSYKCNEETLEFLEKLNNYFREKSENSEYQFTALPLSSEHDDLDDKIEFTFHMVAGERPMATRVCHPTAVRPVPVAVRSAQNGVAVSLSGDRSRAPVRCLHELGRADHLGHAAPVPGHPRPCAIVSVD